MNITYLSRNNLQPLLGIYYALKGMEFLLTAAQKVDEGYLLGWAKKILKKGAS